MSALRRGSWAPRLTESPLHATFTQHAARWPCHRLAPQATKPAVRFASLLSQHTTIRRAGRLTTSASLLAKHTYTESPAGRVYKTTIMAKTVSCSNLVPHKLIMCTDTSGLCCCCYSCLASAPQVGEVREELQRRNVDDRGTKKILVERLYTIIQQEADQMKVSQKAAAAEPEPPPKPEPRPPRTRAAMGAKLQLRSTATPAKRAQRDSKSKRAAAGSSPATSSGPQSLPGATAAQVVRRALMNRIARAAKQSAQQKQQQQAMPQSDTVQAQQQASSGLPAQQQQQQQQQQQPSQAETSRDASAGLSRQDVIHRPQDKEVKTTAFQLAQQDIAEAPPHSMSGTQRTRQQPGTATPVQESDHLADDLATSASQEGSLGVASMQSRTAESQHQAVASSSAEPVQQQQSATPSELSPDANAHLDPTFLNSSLNSVSSTSTPSQDPLEAGLDTKLPSDRAASSPPSTDADATAAERLGSHAQASISSSQSSNLGSNSSNVKSATAGILTSTVALQTSPVHTVSCTLWDTLHKNSLNLSKHDMLLAHSRHSSGKTEPCVAR